MVKICFPIAAVLMQIALAGCFSTGPFGDVGEFEAPGTKSYVGDVIYGYSEETGECMMVQYRLTAEQVLGHEDVHDKFFATNFVARCKLLDVLETNLVSFVFQDRSIVVVKGAIFVKREFDSDGKDSDKPKCLFFAAVYDETPRNKAVVFLIPSDEDDPQPLVNYAFPLVDLDRRGIEVFGKINAKLRKEFDPGLWSWNSKEDMRMNRLDIVDPSSGEPVLTLSGGNSRIVSPDEAEKIDRKNYAVLKVTITPDEPRYSKDGKIRYSKGLRGSIERWHYEHDPDEGPYWLYLDSDYVRAHKRGCRKFEKGRGRHCRGGEFGECCKDRK